MTARTGMTDLLTKLRGMTQAGTADVTINGQAYWTDDQLQDVLDRNRRMLDFVPLKPIPDQVGGGSVEYKEYRANYGNLESGTAVFAVKDGTGTTAGTANYTADYNVGIITFAADTKGTAYYLDARAYDLNGAAADVWTQRAAHVITGAYSWNTDNMSIDKKDIGTNLLDMAEYYRRLSWASAGSVDIIRGDEVLR
jgi:hypothetical protein